MARLLGLIVAMTITAPALAQAPGWSYSPLRGEGDRATLGCDRDATEQDFACMAVRCEDDFSVGVYVHTSRQGGDAGRWEMTVDRENHTAEARTSEAPYGARFTPEDAEWLEERLRHGAFVYLRHVEDTQEAFRFIDLTGSFYAINRALAFCAPRVPAPGPQDESPGAEDAGAE